MSKRLTKLKKTDMYDWFTYIDKFNGEQRGRLKSYNNETQTAYIVFNCGDDWDNWFEYTAEGCRYEDIVRGWD